MQFSELMNSLRRDGDRWSATVPDDIKKLLEEKKAALTAGTTHAFMGPIVDQAGKERVAAGKEPDIGLLKGMDFYVKGVEGSIPK